MEDAVDSNAYTLRSNMFKQTTSALVLREKGMDFVHTHTAIQHISSREFIANSARRIGLVPIWGKGREPSGRSSRPAVCRGSPTRATTSTSARAACKTSWPTPPRTKYAPSRRKRSPTR